MHVKVYDVKKHFLFLTYDKLAKQDKICFIDINNVNTLIVQYIKYHFQSIIFFDIWKIVAITYSKSHVQPSIVSIIIFYFISDKHKFHIITLKFLSCNLLLKMNLIWSNDVMWRIHQSSTIIMIETAINNVFTIKQCA